MTSAFRSARDPSQVQAYQPPPADAMEQWLKIQRMINIKTMSVIEWQMRYGQVTVDTPWGSHFWQGFEFHMRDYMQTHMWGYDLSKAIKVYFKKPHPWSQKTAQSPFEAKQHADGVVYPAFAFEVQPGWYKMVCIHICIIRCRPWSVHYTWLQVAVPMPRP